MTSNATRARGQQMSEANMPDTCQVVSGRTRGPMNPVTGKYDQPGNETYSYEGPVRISGVSVQPTEIDAASQLLVEQDATAAFPLGTSTAIETNQIIRVTESAVDPARVGIEIRIQGPAQLRSYPVDRRFRIEDTA